MLYDANHMRTLTDSELVRLAYIEQNDPTTTALEKELLRRFEATFKSSEIGKIAILAGISASDMRQLAELQIGFKVPANLIQALEILDRFELYDPDELRTVISYVERLQELAANKTTDFLTDLTELLTQSLEINL